MFVDVVSLPTNSSVFAMRLAAKGMCEMTDFMLSRT